MKDRRRRGVSADAVLWVALVIFAAATAQWSERVADFVYGSLPMIRFVVVIAGMIGIGYCVAALRRAAKEQEQALHGASEAMAGLRSPGCDLCGESRALWYCVTHELELCVGCYKRHDPGFSCSIQYIPRLREIQRVGG